MGIPISDRKERWFLLDPPQPTEPDITALAIEANKRKISYGQLVSGTTRFERFEIVEAYKRSRGRGTSGAG